MQETPLRPNAKGNRVRKFQLKGLKPWTMGQCLVAWPYVTGEMLLSVVQEVQFNGQGDFLPDSQAA